ncbi:MAG: hypothetical protein M1839_004171 [Geoglossum umbratile]|nr:MAG: hypothetical protein M1839_004171 [Geoglossum umbratile]
MTMKKVAWSLVGKVESESSARELLNDCLKGKRHHISQQPRGADIQKGHVFVSEANSSGVEEWDDGFTWREVGSSETFKVHVKDGGLYRKTWIFNVNGLEHLVISYCGE